MRLASNHQSWRRWALAISNNLLSPIKIRRAGLGGIITFGGGVPLHQSGQTIGGLGVSGGSSRTGHVIAYRMRRLAGLDKSRPALAPAAPATFPYPSPSSAPDGFQQPSFFPGAGHRTRRDLKRLAAGTNHAPRTVAAVPPPASLSFKFIQNSRLIRPAKARAGAGALA